MCYVFTFAVHAFFIKFSSSALSFHAVFMFATFNLLFVFFLIRPGFIGVRHG